MTDTHTPPPPPAPSSPRPNYVLFGILGSIVGLLIVVIVLLVSGGDEEPGATTAAIATTPPTTATSATSAPSTTTAPTTGAPATTLPPFDGDTADKTAEGDFLGTFNFLHDIRIQQRDGGFTRVVFDFEAGDVPWWSVAYAPGPFVDGSGTTIPIGGSAYLEVLMSASGYDLSGAEVRITYEGPDRIAANTNSVVEVVRTEDFEGVSTWVIAVTGQKPFSVGTLTGPPRVYIDISD